MVGKLNLLHDVEKSRKQIADGQGVTHETAHRIIKIETEKMKVIWTPLALDNAGEISDYIVWDKPDTAAPCVDKLFEQTNLLRARPKIGRIVPELYELNLGELISGNCVIICSIEQTEIHIHTVRNFKRLLVADDIPIREVFELDRSVNSRNMQ